MTSLKITQLVEAIFCRLKNTVTKQNIVNAFIMTLMVVTPVGSAVADDGSNVQRQAQSTRAIDQVKLIGGDVRSRGVGNGINMAIKASARYVVLKIHTDNEELIKISEDALKTMILSGDGEYDRLGILVAQGENGQDNTGELYLGGKVFAKIKDLSSRNAENVIREEIARNYPNVWRKPKASSSVKSKHKVMKVAGSFFRVLWHAMA